MQIDDVIWEILTIGIPEDSEKLKMMIVILGEYSKIEDKRMRLAIWRLRRDLIQIVMISDLASADCNYRADSLGNNGNS